MSRTRFLSIRANLSVALVALVVGGTLVASQGNQNSFGWGASVAEAQNFGQRVVSGSVVNDAAAPLPAATVFLKSLKTKSIRSATTAANGRFRFAQVNMAEDYELWAEIQGKKSAVKTVGTWDTRKEFETELKLK